MSQCATGAPVGGELVGPRTGAIVLGLTLLAYAALALGYATRTAAWQNPDEPAHYNYVAFVAHSGTLPELEVGDWDSALLERLKNGRLQPGDSIDSIRYESWQPPLFYLLAAPVFRLDPTHDQLLHLRLFNVFLGGLALLLAFHVARPLLGDALAAAVPLTMAGIPMFTAVSAALSADPLANLLAAAILLLLVHGVRAGVSSKRAATTGLLLGLGMLTKLALAIFVPIALLVVLFRSCRPRREAAIVLGVAGLLLLPWLVHQVTTYGWTDPLATARHAQVVSDQPRFPGFSPAYIGLALTITFHSFWAQFGWMAIPAPDRLYWIWGGLCVLASLGLGLRSRRGPVTPSWILMLGTLLAAASGYVVYNLTFEQLQGRYLFTALVPIAVLLVAGWAALVPPRSQRLLGIGIGLLLLSLNAYTLTQVLVPGFSSP